MGIRHVYLGGNYIVGTEVTIEKNNWSVSESINSKSMFTFIIVDLNGATLVTGTPVTFYDDTSGDGVGDDDYIWGGTLLSIDDQSLGVGVIFYNVTAVDYNELVERIMVVKGFEDRTIEYMVKYLITNFFQDIDPSISEGTIDADVTINKVPFGYIFGHSALNHLKKFGNYMWNIDKDKNLNFHLIGYTTNPNSIDDDDLRTSINDFRRKRDLTNYRNRQYVKGSDRDSTEQINKTPTPSPNGSNREFFVKYRLSKEPTIEVKRYGGDWEEQTVGNKGLQEDGEFQWWWSYNSTQISHDENETVLASNDEMRVTFVGLIPLIIVVQNNNEVIDRGYYDAYDYNGQLKDTEDALKYGYNLLEKYANEADTLTFTKYEKTYEPGEQVAVYMDELRTIDETFLVKGCTWTPRSNTTITYNYEFLDSPNTGGWEEFFENLIQATKITVDTDEIIIALKQIEEEMSLQGQYEITIYDDLLFPDTSLYPSDTQWPNNSGSSTTDYVYD